MKTLPIIAMLSIAPVFLTGCVIEETEYPHRDRGGYYREGYYDEGPRYRDRSDVVVYEGDRDRHRDRDYDRTRVTERNVYRTNIHENNVTRNVRVSDKHHAISPANVVVTTTDKKKHKKHDHDDDHH